jgi:hypothetical protein
MNKSINIFRSMLAMGTNPEQIEKMILAQNPQLKAISNQIKESGLTPIEFAMKYAKQNNIPLQENALFNMCQQMRSMTPKN